MKLEQEQAKLLCNALRRARNGKDPLIELESACVNLGATRFGEVGEVVAYDATIHDDLDGGILPDDPVKIMLSGLMFPDGATVRAEVRAYVEFADHWMSRAFLEAAELKGLPTIDQPLGTSRPQPKT
tara:strand:+ start:117 stop:497 length:381 start_codon:yes stop_codon:yes gene_type:complete